MAAPRCSRARNDLCRYNRARPPPCMRWRGPCLATLCQVSQLPGLPGPAGRPLVRCTRGRYRFPDPWPRLPGFPPGVVPVSNGESISTVPASVAQGFGAKLWRVFCYPHTVHRTRSVARSQRGLSTVYAQPFPQITAGNPRNTPDMHLWLILVTVDVRFGHRGGLRPACAPAPWPP